MSALDDAEPVWLARARRELGTKEKVGVMHSARILEYHAATRLRAKDDETAWCSSFVCWVFEGCGIASTRSAAARSWLTWGRGIDDPVPGCVVVMTRAIVAGSDDASAAPAGKGGAQGHVGFYVGRSEDGKLLVLGGNQKNRVSIQAYDPARVLAYRWPDLG